MPFGPLFRRDPIRVQPFFGFRTADRLFLTARAIRSREPVFEKRSFWRDFATMVALYTSKEVADFEVELEFRYPDGRTLAQSAKTGPEGYVRFELPLDPHAPPGARTRWEKALIRWTGALGEAEEAPAYILTPGTQTSLGVISDVDDTILETGITGSLRAIARNWKRVMAQMPSERIIVPGATSFFSAIGGGPGSDRTGSERGNESDGERAFASPIDPETPEARVRPIFYVSSSPWNLFSYLVAFQRERGLPLGPVMLRDWGFNRRTLGKEGHGSHKRETIRRILTTFPALKFALIGDDTQKDLAAFGSIAAEFPGRIAAVFIRSVTGEPFTDEELHARDIIETAGVPFWTGSDYGEAKAFLRGAGLDIEGGVKRLVRQATKRD